MRSSFTILIISFSVLLAVFVSCGEEIKTTNTTGKSTLKTNINKNSEITAYDQSNSDAAKAELRILAKAVEMFKLRTAQYPETLEELITGPSDWDKKWISLIAGSKIPKDPWGNDYLIDISDSDGFTLICLGKDGSEGGEGFDEDIYYP